MKYKATITMPFYMVIIVTLQINLHIFNLTDVGNFGSWMCKIEPFFYFSLSDAFCT